MSPLGALFKNCAALKSKVENQKVQFFAVVSIYSVQRCLGKCKKPKIAQINVLDAHKNKICGKYKAITTFIDSIGQKY